MKRFSPLYFYAALFLVYLVAGTAFAAQRGEVGLRGSNGAVQYLDTSTTNVTSSAWVQLVASMPFACSSILIQNSGSSVLQMALGGSGAEVAIGLFVPSQAWLLPVQFGKGQRVSLKSMGATQSTGTVSMTCFQ